MPSLAAKLEYVSVEDFLAGERASEVKHEYVDGQVYAMAGASVRHNLIAGNMYALLWNHLRGAACFPLTNDMLLKTSKSKFRYPDLMVVCEGDSSDDDYIREQPVLVVEVLSRSTRRQDKTEKRAEYLALPSLQEYVLIEQEYAEVEVQRRRNQWQPEFFYLGQAFMLESVNANLSVEELYQRVDNDDVKAYLEQKQLQSEG
ncbi:Uma2 family endonuclease [Candidatus Thiothrix sp. Deng01]|uniref:Uma2 family endonuclease n=1 Tax=Candidatus Thiothrix phosphatis TaxID=3112415 RepID=A0ABU6D1B0_9GAMM|nr:Uma2 family endonuclease [Candidatus Thiothrix sp. Deng01]MEB4592844.1 Uma2 family endonuclease [Candidatus Thiothrix sp. Deng01]